MKLQNVIRCFLRVDMLKTDIHFGKYILGLGLTQFTSGKKNFDIKWAEFSNDHQI